MYKRTLTVVPFFFSFFISFFLTNVGWVFGALVLRPFDALEVNTLLEHLPQWRHLAKALDVLDAPLDAVVDLLFGGEASCKRTKIKLKK